MLSDILVARRSLPATQNDDSAMQQAMHMTLDTPRASGDNGRFELPSVATRTTQPTRTRNTAPTLARRPGTSPRVERFECSSI